ncbi:T-complex protein 11-domain-containing protein [Blastocladiella britannica]|nr:T-complex protein 11-domain-containing protein [Blastocladiella britannica]
MHPTTSHSGSVSPRPPQQNQQQQQKQQLGDGSTVVDAKSPAGNPTSSSNGSTASTGSAAMDLAAALSSGGGPSMSGTGTSYMAGNQHQHHNHGSGPVSKRAAFVPSIVSIVDSMTTAAAGTLALPPMTPASAREPRSAVFFVDLTSPVSMKPLATITTSTTTTSRAPLVSPTAQKMRLAVRLAEASHARSSIMHERKRKLRLRADYIKRKVMLQRHRDRLMAMKHKAAVDFALSSAHIKRQLMLQDRAEHFGAIVDRAQRVAIMRRLEQSAALRRSVSASFAETLGALVSLDDYLEAEEMAEAGDDFGELNDGDEGGSTPNRFPAAIVTSSSSSATRHDEPAYVSPTSPVSPSVAGHLVHAAAATSPTSSTGTTPTPTPASVRSNSSVMKTPTPFSATVTAPPTDISAAAGAFDSDPATPPASPKRAGSPIAGKVATATVRFESMPALLTLSAVLDRVREADNHPETPSPVGAPRPADVLPGSRVGLAPTSTTAHDDIEEVGGLDGLLPPITRHTLRELDVTEILANAQLRHDLIFDPDMQFRPNLDGGRGTARAAKSDAYWAEIEAEIADAERADRVGPAARQQRSWFRVPMLLLEIREIVRELLVPGTPSSTGTGTSVAAPGEPATLNHQLNEIMDIDLMTQALQQSRSLANAAGGAVAFIASQMHAYCAPCRDPLIDSMVEKFTTGQYVDGFKLCLEVCEFMKTLQITT